MNDEPTDWLSTDEAYWSERTARADAAQRAEGMVLSYSQARVLLLRVAPTAEDRAAIAERLGFQWEYGSRTDWLDRMIEIALGEREPG